MSTDAAGIWLHSLKYTVANSRPSSFSVRSLSSTPPNTICEPFWSVAIRSVFCRSYCTPGKHSRITFGNVSPTMLARTWFSRKRKIACLEFGALSARITTLRVSRNVLPLREPPNSIRCVASPASTSCAASWRAVNVTLTASRLS